MISKEDITGIIKAYDKWLRYAVFPSYSPDDEIVQEYAVKKKELQKEYAPIMYHQEEYDEAVDELFREYFYKWYVNQTK